MASKGGNLFGPPTGQSNPLTTGSTQFGASQAASSGQPGLFSYGGMSQFGGGGAGGLFGASSAPLDDQYANIEIDLTKVKKSEPPAKPWEQKTEEEKKKE